MMNAIVTTSSRMFLRWFLRLAPALALLGAFLLGAPDAGAQEDFIPPQPIDLAVEIEYHRVEQQIVLIIVNNSDVTVYNVRIEIEPKDRLVASPPLGSVGFHSADGILTIPSIPASVIGKTLEIVLSADPSVVNTGVFPIRASIVSSWPRETPEFEYNNRAERWVMSFEGNHLMSDTKGSDIGLRVSADNLNPALNGQSVFTVDAVNTRHPSSGAVYDKSNVRVKITLTPGLSFASSSMPATTISGNTATWRVGDLPAARDATRSKSLSVPVNLSGSAPLERRCLTAEVDQVLPPDSVRLRYDNVARVCLGDGPPELIGGINPSDHTSFALISFFPCIGVTVYPCNTDDTVELVSELDLRTLRIR